MILRCMLPRRGEPSQQCRGWIGGVPDGATVESVITRVEDAPDGCFALTCFRCRRIIVVCPPLEKAA